MEKKLVDKELDKVSAGLTEEQKATYKKLQSEGKYEEARDFMRKCIDENPSQLSTEEIRLSKKHGYVRNKGEKKGRGV